MRDTIIIVGRGKLANNIHNGLLNHLSDYQIDYWENIENYSTDKLIIIHIGSGRQLSEVIEFCNQNKTPLIQGSTGMNLEQTSYDFTFIDAPNLSILMLKFMYMLKQSGDLFKDYKISITESHQSIKKTVPGTAIEMADSLGVAAKEIKSVRDQAEQLNTYGITKEFLSLHAYHNICIEDEGTKINFETLVEGHDSYINGLSKIIKCLNNLEDKYYHILDLIEMKLV
jgi:dihydrodipicolinate reductase